MDPELYRHLIISRLLVGYNFREATLARGLRASELAGFAAEFAEHSGDDSFSAMELIHQIERSMVSETLLAIEDEQRYGGAICSECHSQLDNGGLAAGA